MSYLQLNKQHIEAIKGISRIFLFLLKKSWLQVSILTSIILIIRCFYGWTTALTIGTIGVMAVIYKVGDWFVYHPMDPPDSRINVASPSILRLPYESHFIQTIDGVTINVVLIKQEPDKISSVPTIVYLHGNAGNVGHRLQNVHEMYHYLKCNILLVEYRGYGLSKGSPSESGLYLDGEAALHYLLQHPSIDKESIILFGRSLGGAVAIDLVRNSTLSPHIAGIMIENTFTSIPDIAKILFDCRLIRMIPKWFYKNKFDSVSKVPRIQTPILYLSGLNDELIPPVMMNILFQNSSASIFKQFHSFEGGTHNFTWRCNDYYDVIARFIHKVTSTRTTPASIANHYTISSNHPVTPEKGTPSTKDVPSASSSLASTVLLDDSENGNGNHLLMDANASAGQLVVVSTSSGTTNAGYYGLISPTTFGASVSTPSQVHYSASVTPSPLSASQPLISSIVSNASSRTQSQASSHVYYSISDLNQHSTDNNGRQKDGGNEGKKQKSDEKKDLFSNIEII